MGKSTRYIGYYSSDGSPTKHGLQLRLIREEDNLSGEGISAKNGKFTLFGTATDDNYEWTINFEDASMNWQGELDGQEISGKWNRMFLGKEFTGDFYLRPFQRGEDFHQYARDLIKETDPSICSQCGVGIREDFNYCYNCEVELEFSDVDEEIIPAPSIPIREKSLGRKIFELGLFFISMDSDQDPRALVIIDRFFAESQLEIDFDHERVARRFLADMEAGEVDMEEILEELDRELDPEQKATIYAMAMAIVSANEQVTQRDRWALKELSQAWEDDIDWEAFEPRFEKIINDFRRAHHKE